MISFPSLNAPARCQTTFAPAAFGQLISDARNGCPVACNNLAALFHPFVTQLARHIIPGRLRAKVDPEDLAQDVLLEMYHGLERFHGLQRDQIRAWLRRATLNRGRDLMRRYGPGTKRDASREQVSSCPDDSNALRHFENRSDCPPHQAMLRELRIAIRAAIRRLPVDQRRVVELACLRQQSYAEIAPVLNRSSEAVRKLYQRACNQLKEELKDFARLD